MVEPMAACWGAAPRSLPAFDCITAVLLGVWRESSGDGDEEVPMGEEEEVLLS